MVLVPSAAAQMMFAPMVVAHPADVIDGLEAIGTFIHRSVRWVRNNKHNLPLHQHPDGGIFALRSELLDYLKSLPPPK